MQATVGPGTEIEPLIFWDFEQGSTMRLAGIPIDSKFYLIGTVIARGLFEYSGAAGLGAPVRVCVSQRGRGDTDRHGPTVGILPANSQKCGRRLCPLYSTRS